MVVIPDYGIQKIMGHREGVFMVIRLGRKLSFRPLCTQGWSKCLKAQSRASPPLFRNAVYIFESYGVSFLLKYTQFFLMVRLTYHLNMMH